MTFGVLAGFRVNSAVNITTNRTLPLLFLLIPAFTGDSQHIVVQRDVHVLLLDAREFCPDHQIGVLRKRV